MKVDCAGVHDVLNLGGGEGIVVDADVIDEAGEWFIEAGAATGTKIKRYVVEYCGAKTIVCVRCGCLVAINIDFHA